MRLCRLFNHRGDGVLAVLLLTDAEFQDPRIFFSKLLVFLLNGFEDLESDLRMSRVTVVLNDNVACAAYLLPDGGGMVGSIGCGG